MTTLQRESIEPRLDGIEKEVILHFYAEITPEELYEIINKHLVDIVHFVEVIKDLLRDPEARGFTL